MFKNTVSQNSIHNVDGFKREKQYDWHGIVVSGRPFKCNVIFKGCVLVSFRRNAALEHCQLSSMGSGDCNTPQYIF
jgi:hypothetical protein